MLRAWGSSSVVRQRCLAEDGKFGHGGNETEELGGMRFLDF